MKVNAQAAIPALDGVLRLRGLNTAVSVYRDRWGIPHVRAASVADLFFAQGFVTAQDRLFQMEYDRLRGEGRVASVVGRSGLAWDRFARRVRLASTARYVFDLSGFGASGWVVPPGASGHPASPHFADQQRAWADGDLLPIIADWTQLAREAEATQQLEPEAG